MDEYGYFWNSKNGDRQYNADSFEHWLKKFFTTGVFNGELQVTATGGMGISVSSGYANVEGKVRLFDDESFTLEPAYLTVSRVDTVVIERNENDRIISLKLIKGGTDGVAVPPERTGGIYQLVIAQITVGANVASISQQNILDTRWDADLCGYVASTVTEIDFSQMAAQFNDWFENFRSELDGDVAANLLAKIETLDDEKSNNESWVTYTIAAANWAQDVYQNWYYSFESIYPSNTWDILDILPVKTTTQAMRNAWITADCGGHDSENKIWCKGVVPTIDIVMSLCVKKKGDILP